MTIAEQKKSENIVEYVLYLWQMQDMVRAADMDLSTIRHFLTNANHDGTIDIDAEMTWFADLIKTMRANKLERKGNLPETDELLIELNYLHHTLIDLIKDKVYTEKFNGAQTLLNEFLQRSGNPQMNPIEAMFTALYGLLVLRLQKKSPSASTLTAIDAFKEVLVLLGGHYHDMRSGNKHFSMN